MVPETQPLKTKLKKEIHNLKIETEKFKGLFFRSLQILRNSSDVEMKQRSLQVFMPKL